MISLRNEVTQISPADSTFLMAAAIPGGATIDPSNDGEILKKVSWSVDYSGSSTVTRGAAYIGVVAVQDGVAFGRFSDFQLLLPGSANVDGTIEGEFEALGLNSMIGSIERGVLDVSEDALPIDVGVLVMARADLDADPRFVASGSIKSMSFQIETQAVPEPMALVPLLAIGSCFALKRRRKIWP